MQKVRSATVTSSSRCVIASPRLSVARNQLNTTQSYKKAPLRSTSIAPTPQLPHAGANQRQTRCLSASPAAPAPAPVDERIPVTVITGFLGSGKTTLLNNLLTQPHGKRIAVIENEFGEVDIDSELVAKQEVLEGTMDTITQLSNGCLCCTVRDDLIVALNNLWLRRKESKIDHIVIETTGLGKEFHAFRHCHHPSRSRS